MMSNITAPKAVCIALLCRYMESFNAGASGDTLILPSNVLERWFSKFEDRFRRDPDFLVRRGEVA